MDVFLDKLPVCVLEKCSLLVLEFPIPHKGGIGLLAEQERAVEVQPFEEVLLYTKNMY